jgi:hypothetical protein
MVIAQLIFLAMLIACVFVMAKSGSSQDDQLRPPPASQGVHTTHAASPVAGSARARARAYAWTHCRAQGRPRFLASPAPGAPTCPTRRRGSRFDTLPRTTYNM